MSFSDLKAIKNIGQAEIDYLTQLCFRDCSEVQGHLFYKGQNRGSYSQTSFTLRGIKFHTRKHQLSLFLKLKAQSFDMDEWGDNVTASHLCHQKSCLKDEHLSLETLEINRERDECLRRRRCLGHKDHPDCLV